MDMNTAFYQKAGQRKPQWHVIDATGKVAGRLATEVAALLRGKKDPSYTPHTDAGDYVVVINSEKIVLTGDKLEGKEYVWYT
jgi:large subunit ribosomal protein L13